MSRARPSHTRRSGTRRSPLGAVALVALALTPATGFAQASAVPPQVVQQLNSAAVEGPGALLDALSRELARNPGLAANPDTASALARAAATPVPQFVGANMPVYREIARLITDAAPAGARAAVGQSVDNALGPYASTDLNVTPRLRPGATGALSTQPAPVAALGYKIGSFTIYPDVQGATFFDDNIYATAHDRVSDWVTTVSPRIALQSNWKRNSLYAEAQTDITNYWSHTDENSVDWHALTEGQIDITDNTRAILGAAVLGEHEDRSSPDDVEGIKPTRYYEQNGYAGLINHSGNITTRVGGAVEHINFDNVMGTHGEIDNQDRNRTRYTFGTLFRYDANAKFRPFVEVMGDFRRYDSVPDDFGFNRNSDGFLAGVGALFTINEKLSGEFFFGALHRTYSDPAFKSLTVPAADATLRWQATPTTAVVLFTERTVEETTLYGSPAYVYTLGGGRVEQKLLPKLTGIVRVAYANSDFAQVDRKDDDIDTSVGLRYQFTRNLTLGIDYRFTQRLAGDPSYDFTRNEVYFRVGASF